MMTPYLLIDPAVEQCSLHPPSPCTTAGGEATSHNIIIREDGSVLCHYVKQVDPTHLDCLANVVIGCRGRVVGLRYERLV